MQFRLLGPLEVADGDRIVELGEGRQRKVLVLLALHRNQAVSSERLVDTLWGERPPATVGKVLQNHVAQLRRALDDAEGSRLQTRAGGYALRIEDGELDLDRFDQLDARRCGAEPGRPGGGCRAPGRGAGAVAGPRACGRGL